jgi:hypothetical protein
VTTGSAPEPPPATTPERRVLPGTAFLVRTALVAGALGAYFATEYLVGRFAPWGISAVEVFGAVATAALAGAVARRLCPAAPAPDLEGAPPGVESVAVRVARPGNTGPECADGWMRFARGGVTLVLATGEGADWLVAAGIVTLVWAGLGIAVFGALGTTSGVACALALGVGLSLPRRSYETFDVPPAAVTEITSFSDCVTVSAGTGRFTACVSGGQKIKLTRLLAERCPSAVVERRAVPEWAVACGADDPEAGVLEWLWRQNGHQKSFRVGVAALGAAVCLGAARWAGTGVAPGALIALSGACAWIAAIAFGWTRGVGVAGGAGPADASVGDAPVRPIAVRFASRGAGHFGSGAGQVHLLPDAVRVSAREAEWWDALVMLGAWAALALVLGRASMFAAGVVVLCSGLPRRRTIAVELRAADVVRADVRLDRVTLTLRDPEARAEIVMVVPATSRARLLDGLRAALPGRVHVDVSASPASTRAASLDARLASVTAARDEASRRLDG